MIRGKHRNNTKAKAILILIAAIVLAIVICIIAGVAGKTGTVTVTGGQLKYTVDENKYYFTKEPVICGFQQDSNQSHYLPVDDILSTYGYSVSINKETGDVAVTGHDKAVNLSVNSVLLIDDENTYTYNYPIIEYDDVIYISSEMLSYFTDDKFVFVGDYEYVEYVYAGAN